jgi:hypothetical protein
LCCGHARFTRQRFDYRHAGLPPLHGMRRRQRHRQN